MAALQERLQSGARSILVEGLSGPASSLLAAALAEKRCVILVVASQEAGERAADALAVFLEPGVSSYLVGHSAAFLDEGSPSTSAASSDRMMALYCLATGKPCLLIATAPGLLQFTYTPDDLRKAVLELEPGSELDFTAALHHLVRVGYERVDMVQGPGEFAARGGILDVWPTNGRAPLRIDLFGDQIDTIRQFEPTSQRSTGSVLTALILPAAEPISGASSTLLEYLPSDALLVVDDASSIQRRWKEWEGEVRDQMAAFAAGLPARSVFEEDSASARSRGKVHAAEDEPAAAPVFPFRALSDATHQLESFQGVFLNHLSRSVPWGRPSATLSLTCEPVGALDGNTNALVDRIKGWLEHGMAPWLVTAQWSRLAELLSAQGLKVWSPATAAELQEGDGSGSGESDGSPSVVLSPGGLSAGFFMPAAHLVVLSDAEIFGGVKIRRSGRTSREAAPLLSLLELKPGDLVVHVDHGIASFRGLKSMDVEGVRRDYLHLEYAQGDKLYVPSDQIERVQRYIGSEDHPPAIHRLGGTDWARTKRKVKEAVEEMARELIELYAARSSRDGNAFSPDTPWQGEMEAAFVYEETQDQLRAIADVKGDMESSKPMDRLICGDVGYGKTEVAIRAAFKVVMEGKQVAVLVPTTVLAQQHLNTFTERLSGFPVRVDMLSRFRSRKEQTQTVNGLKEGSVDIVIGTHRLLSKDVGFKDLGLVVVDEEQRFGVGHKEKLKQLRQLVDVLTLTATPIPRTLHMSLSTIRDMSVMNQAPEGRTAVRTYLREYSDDLVRQSILRELERDGQVYFVHNRVDNLSHFTEKLRKLVPQARVGMAHGQMHENDLEAVMLDFYDRRYDVLCCTTIIESGLDIPNVNTICINDADRLGLAQLYQLRGRVGRSNRQAYCYLMIRPDKEVTELAQKRLHALREFTDLGSGFRIALRDLEIRGAGNILGSEQHGAMMSVGFDLYCEMIADAIRVARNEPPPPPPLPPVDLPIAAFIPSVYIPADSLRIEFYKRLSRPLTVEDVQACQEEMQDRFGALPAPVRNLLAILRLRLQSQRIGVNSIVPEKTQVVIRLGPKLRLSPGAITSLQAKHRGVRALTDRVLVPLGSLGALGHVSKVMDTLQAMRERRRVADVKS
ncbi:MAG: transcription-repair coupling factor [Armatimonadota bacterium]|nr:transcription-repair coupling factor [Armatimonadota bacterium]